VTAHAALGDRVTGWYQGRELVLPSDRDFCGNDLAVLILKAPIPPGEGSPLTPLVEPSFLDPARFSRAIAAVAYGATGFFNVDYGTRRLRTGISIECIAGGSDEACSRQSLGKMRDGEFLVSGGLCQGDSGAAAIDQGTWDARAPLVVGVLSRASNNVNDCVSAIFARTDVWGHFIAKAARRAAVQGGYAPPAWATTPGVLGAGALGDHCSDGTDCGSAVCASQDDGLNYACAQPCPCPDAFTCVTAGSSAMCFKKASPPRAPSVAPDAMCGVAPGRRPTERDTPTAVGAAVLAVASILRRRRQPMAAS
jgi:hypothetical protein